MKDNLKENIIKEYEMLISETREQLKIEQRKFVCDNRYIVELASLYGELLKKFATHNSEAEEESINAYIDRIAIIQNIKDKNYMKKVKNNLLKKIRKEVEETDVMIEGYIIFRLLYSNKINKVSRIKKEWTEIKEQIDNLTYEEINMFINFINTVSNEIYSQMNKKNLMKSILTTVGMGLATVTGVFFIKKMTTDTKDVAVGLEKDTLNKITGDSISEKEKTIKETLQCINKPESLTKNM